MPALGVPDGDMLRQVEQYEDVLIGASIALRFSIYVSTPKKYNKCHFTEKNQHRKS